MPEGATTVKYMILLYGPDLPEPGTPEAAKMLAEWTSARQAMTDAGVLIDCAPLQPPAASTTVRVRDGETLLTDGPAAEIKEVFGGFTLIGDRTSGPELVRGGLCDQAVRLARALAALLPSEPEAAGLLAFLLLTDARRDARVDGAGNLVLLADQDRSRWDQERIAEGELLLEAALRAGRPGPYQLHAAIAACHSCAAALALGMSAPERAFIERRLAAL